ncbi:MAG TPA: hypothetical protein VJO15_08475 [Dehalococcoidia bacterium]|nr:hypothetical protein [Dehalococcoidia bacterium]
MQEMLTGFNTDFKYKGVVYHVQTEDNGRQNPVIVTLLYKGGAILASRKISYADIVKYERLEKVVRGLMEEQHKQVIRDLVAGKFGVQAGPDKKAEIIEPASPPGAQAAGEPGGEGGAKPAGMDDIILEYLASEDERK